MEAYEIPSMLEVMQADTMLFSQLEELIADGTATCADCPMSNEIRVPVIEDGSVTMEHRDVWLCLASCDPASLGPMRVRPDYEPCESFYRCYGMAAKYHADAFWEEHEEGRLEAIREGEWE